MLRQSLYVEELLDFWRRRISSSSLRPPDTLLFHLHKMQPQLDFRLVDDSPHAPHDGNDDGDDASFRTAAPVVLKF